MKFVKKCFFVSTVIGLFVLSLLYVSMTYAQPVEDECPDHPKKQEDRVKLDDVFVHAFHGGAITFTPTSTIVDVDKYIKSGAVERIEDILMNMAGIDIMRGSAIPDSQQVMMLRGFDDSRFTVAMDGRPITGSTGKSVTTIDWSSLTLADIEKIEVIRGGASAAFENSPGGIINIIMKKGRKRETLKPKITLQHDSTLIADYTDPTAYAERIIVDGGVGELGYYLNFGHKSADGYLRNNNWRGNDYSARLTYLFPFKGFLTLSYKGNDFEREIPVVNQPGRPDYDPGYPTVPEDADTLRYLSAVSYPGGNSYKEKSTEHLDFSFEQPIKETTLKLHLYSTESEENVWYFTNSWFLPLNNNGNLVQVHWGGEDQIEKHVGGGIEWALNPLENSSLDIGYNYKKTGTEEMPKIFEIHAGYFEGLWMLSPKWTLKTGLRASYCRQHTYPWVTKDPAISHRHLYHDLFWLPKFALTYNLRPETSVYVSVNREYHIPGC